MNNNKELQLAWDFVNKSSRNIFLTGKAGTGKTTFLHKLKLKSPKRMVIVAPTGVAAINAKGVTIHSFFQLPFGPVLPDNMRSSKNGFKNKFSKTKINIIKSLDLLVIDEISMVRADLLDAIDKILRRYKDRNQVFGGVQVLMIGDLQQLSPVVRDNEWELLKPFYNNPYFFSSHAYQYCNPITIELKHIYRQDNPKFIEILNEIRSNRLSQNSIEELNKRFDSNFSPSENEGYIFLTTHNSKADQINNSELDKLSTKNVSYSAKVEGKYPEHSFPNEDKLVLNVGAQVMFIKNDSSPEKRYFNGKIGKVIHLDRDEVVVKCPDDDFTIITKPETWENITYKVDKETDAITEEKIGSYTQMPLRLAWAITIHKSQGLTFEKAVIDADGAFAHGQTYVALSRCKSLEGLVLKSKIDSRHIINDTNVLNFTKQAEENQPDETELKQSKSIFQLQLISEVFDFFQFIYPVNRILDIYYKNRGSIEGHLEQPLTSIKNRATNLLKVANTFKNQLKELAQDKLPENDQVIQERFKKAINYFSDETKSKIIDEYQNFSFSTDNKALDKDISKQLDTIEELIATKKLYFSELKDGFEVNKFLGLRAKSVFLTKDQPKKLRKTVIDVTTNIELFELLRTLRNTLAQEHDLIHYQIFTQKSLYEMCKTLPTTKKELLQVNGFGKLRVEKYGNDILSVIKDYCEDNGIDTSDVSQFQLVEEKKPKRKKGDTQKESLALFKEGKTIEEIAHLRELNENTIFGHLAKFIKSGEIKIYDLMPKAHYQELKKLIPKHSFDTLSDLKHQLDDKYSYGEIRLVLEELNS
ncbi:helicase [Winogradskyella sp. J14-2]|uniref:helix-turn-helix domain-containing protein n=1 Tax=Winogradskyella sp. J14-2 TaxID=1936080 RepID=UPI0009727A74|nr:helix-turn-helix domain-containing protein [Winogradskyella sp. J14-2]APY08927.1 helicase [Winogradskyella sp. J14-2]